MTEVRERGQVATPGEVSLFIVDDVAESFLRAADELISRIDELEIGLNSADPRDIERRLSKMRRDLLQLRRLVTPTRDAVRRVVDNKVELDTGTVFPRELELAYGDVYDKLLRAGDSLETAQSLIGGIRDFTQAKIAYSQNETIKRLTAGASLLLVPTLIVGIYGQDFVDMPELKWAPGYAYSWTLIIITTLIQLWWFRRKGWI